MRLYASQGCNRYIELLDANGVRLERVTVAFTETGLTRQHAVNAFGEFILHDEKILEDWVYHPAPLRVFDTRLGLEITSQSQLDYINRSRRAAHAANLRWEYLRLRANLRWEILCRRANIAWRLSPTNAPSATSTSDVY
jgi:hypothetical protein